MGHRALVAYERPDGQYNLHYCHWGACNLRLNHTITDATPFGADTPSTERQQLLADLLTDQSALASDDAPPAADDPQPQVQLEPRATALSKRTAIDELLDFLHHEAFYVVDREFEVTAYRTFWFGLQFDCQQTGIDHPTIGFGALKTLRWHEGAPVGDADDRGRWRALKDVTGDMLDRGVFSEDEALGYLKAKLIRWARDEETLLFCGVDIDTSG